MRLAGCFAEQAPCLTNRRGAKKPARIANSASGCPEGSFQLRASSHSSGKGLIPVRAETRLSELSDLRLVWPAFIEF